LSPEERCSKYLLRVDPAIIPTLARRITPAVRETATSRARSARATAVLFAVGALLTLVDALMTRDLLRNAGMSEQWTPVRALMGAVGIDLALAICSVLAVGSMAVVAWGSVRARPAIASWSFIVLCGVVALRVCGCVNNFGVMLT
jgi:hypothetical protein